MELSYPEIRYRIEQLSTEINTNHHDQLRVVNYDARYELVEKCTQLERERRKYLELQEKFIPD
jgi:hypothetical protein